MYFHSWITTFFKVPPAQVTETFQTGTASNEKVDVEKFLSIHLTFYSQLALRKNVGSLNDNFFTLKKNKIRAANKIMYFLV